MADRYVVIGNPVAHSKSPWIHAQFAQQTRQAIEYGQLEAPLDGFARSVHEFRAAGGRGANVTVPFKQEAFMLCRHAVSARARAAGAVNTLIFDAGSADGGMHGDNTDGVGLLRDITVNLGRAIAAARVLLMGAGGAAQGVVDPLLAAQPLRLVIANRSAAKSRALAQRCGAEGGGYEELAGAQFDLLINATSAGLTDETPPLPPGVFAPGALGYDMVYGRDTPFLAMARAAGAEARDGAGMLVEQAAESFLLWRGMRPQTAPVLAALRLG